MSGGDIPHAFAVSSSIEAGDTGADADATSSEAVKMGRALAATALARAWTAAFAPSISSRMEATSIGVVSDAASISPVMVQ